MNHQNLQDQLPLYLDAELPETERSEIAKHLPSCPDCQTKLKHMDAIRGALRPKTPLPYSEWFVASVMKRLDALETKQAPVSTGWQLPKWLVPTLGYGLAFLLLIVAVTHQESLVNAETVLLSDIPQSSNWAFASEDPGVNNLMGISREEL